RGGVGDGSHERTTNRSPRQLRRSFSPSSSSLHPSSPPTFLSCLLSSFLSVPLLRRPFYPSCF
ncbi:hypothetical protein SK128_006902, partial [Halocaridina rubra]